MKIVFPGGKKVDALHRGFTIHTDQPEAAGGANTAPSPFDLFLASLGTCAGYYVLAFCQKRGIPTTDVSLDLSATRDDATHRVTGVDIRLVLPPDFPAEYVQACVRSAEQCTVKHALQEPPSVSIRAERS